MWTIYCYQNKINGKRYIGTTNKTQKKRSGKDGKEYMRSDTKFCKAIKEFGWENFEYSELEKVNDEFEASELECYYINLFDTSNEDFGYNGNKGGCVPTRKEIIQYDKNGNEIGIYKNPKEAQEATGIAACLIIESCKNNVKLAGGFVWRYKKQRGIKLEDIYTVPFSGERPITQLNQAGEVLAFYDSAKEAEQATSALRSKICMCCKGQRKTAGGYKWEYTDGFGLKDVYNPIPSPVQRVRQYSLQGDFIAEFDSQNDAHRKTGFSASMIGECCRGKREKACGYIWRYV